jgi:hypothetical protein
VTEANKRRGPGTRKKVSSRRTNLECNTHAQEINVSQLPVSLSLSQPAKTLGPPYYCLYSLFNKIRDKGKTVSAGWGKGGEMTQTLYAHMNKKKKTWEGVGAGGRNKPSLVCTYE